MCCHARDKADYEPVLLSNGLNWNTRALLVNTYSFILVSEVHEPALLEPLPLPFLGVLDGLHDTHERDVGAG